MGVSASQLNKFLFVKLPSAFLCGVRVKSIDEAKCVTSVKFRWINQNPFNSMYFAVQAMAAELSTGALVINHINNSGKKVSMLVASNKAVFTKKAVGRITFTCNDGDKIRSAIQETIRTGEGVTCWMTSIAVNEKGEQVSVMDFEWTLKAK
ncbi:DUF4442 domain-containing protein [Flavobacterium sp. MAH-1]|uniref:DUF4442 domain-containing protein n=1 Tax=Flavobacterium agri TaxID=2743471 RepID=A0A7Y8Y1U7_9FLAO|nr:DUF4442 domain-containing protein [Flavobacterium agri]NUY81055.1 DUF4442 domain-containing protein [Flavobacterium agri]NYA71079.1 DUF4442 domain-containing protein [Flavobacterium agri]